MAEYPVGKASTAWKEPLEYENTRYSRPGARAFRKKEEEKHSQVRLYRSLVLAASRRRRRRHGRLVQRLVLTFLLA